MEHGLATWALFIDLVKTFDNVPREALFEILRRFSSLDNYFNIVIYVREHALINVNIG